MKLLKLANIVRKFKSIDLKKALLVAVSLCNNFVGVPAHKHVLLDPGTEVAVLAGQSDQSLALELNKELETIYHNKGLPELLNCIKTKRTPGDYSDEVWRQVFTETFYSPENTTFRVTKLRLRPQHGSSVLVIDHSGGGAVHVIDSSTGETRLWVGEDIIGKQADINSHSFVLSKSKQDSEGLNMLVIRDNITNKMSCLDLTDTVVKWSLDLPGDFYNPALYGSTPTVCNKQNGGFALMFTTQNKLMVVDLDTGRETGSMEANHRIIEEYSDIINAKSQAPHILASISAAEIAALIPESTSKGLEELSRLAEQAPEDKVRSFTIDLIAEDMSKLTNFIDNYPTEDCAICPENLSTELLDWLPYISNETRFVFVGIPGTDELPECKVRLHLVSPDNFMVTAGAKRAKQVFNQSYNKSRKQRSVRPGFFPRTTRKVTVSKPGKFDATIEA